MASITPWITCARRAWRCAARSESAGEKPKSSTSSRSGAPPRCGEEARGRALCEASLAICRELGEGGGTGLQLLSLGCFAWRHGDLAGAQQEVEESLTVSQKSATPVMIGPCLVWLGIILVARGQPSSAARLWGAADRVGEPAGMTGQQLFDLPIIGELDPEARGYYARAESTARGHLGEAAFRPLGPRDAPYLSIRCGRRPGGVARALTRRAYHLAACRVAALTWPSAFTRVLRAPNTASSSPACGDSRYVWGL